MYFCTLKDVANEYSFVVMLHDLDYEKIYIAGHWAQKLMP
jgi:hypothetical protein